MIPVYQPWINDVDRAFVADAMESGWVSSKGPYIQKFEEALAEYIGVKYVLATNTGTAACHLAMLACGIGYGHKVAVPDLTFIATANAVSYTGAECVLLDVDIDTWNTTEIELAKRSEQIDFMFGVPLLGNPVSYSLKNLCRKREIVYIEDSCEAIGSIDDDGKKTGASAKCSVLSFFGNKVITTGEGGALLTNDEEVYQKAKLYQGQGQTQQYVHDVVGYNYRMTNVQAALGYSQLQRINDILMEKHRVFYAYRRHFNLFEPVTLQETTFAAKSNKWMIGILIEDSVAYKRITERLVANKIDFRPMFKPISQQTPYKYLNTHNKTAEYLSQRVIMLPSYPELDDQTIMHICNIIKEGPIN